MAMQDAFFSSIGSIPYDDTVTPYAFDTTGRMRVGTAPAGSTDVLRLVDISTTVLSSATPLSVGTTASAGSSTKGSRDNHIHPGVDLGNAQTITARKTFSTDLLTPLVIGGVAADSSLVLKSTEGVGTSDFIRLLVGNNGAVEAVRIITDGSVGVGTASPTAALDVRQLTTTTFGLVVRAIASSVNNVFRAEDSAGTPRFRIDQNFDTIVRSVAGSDVAVWQSNGSIVIGASSTNKSLELAGTGAVRMAITGGTALATTDWALTSGWGANATISAVTGNDVRGTVTVTTSALDTPTVNPIITLTFKDGTWTSTPFAIADMNSAGTGPMGAASCNPSATTLAILFVGTPSALLSRTYIFNYWVVG